MAPRTHFVTGFHDGCARQFTAALALFGDVATHEAMRYAAPRGAPYDATDTAYEEIKGRVCGARSGQPCGDRLDGLAAGTAFVSAYPASGDSAPLDILLHRGEVVAADFRGGRAGRRGERHPGRGPGRCRVRPGLRSHPSLVVARP